MTVDPKGRITRDSARPLMEAVDEATKQALTAMGLEAFRFDADVCLEEQWIRLKIKIRPLGQYEVRMDEKEFAHELLGILSEGDEGDFLNQDSIRRIETFEEAGVLTRDAGLVVMMADGAEFQITVVQSKRPAK